MTNKESKVVRESMLETVAGVEFEGMEFVGRTSEGALFRMGEDFVVVRTIVKSETFDADEALRKFNEAQEKAAAKAAEKAAKDKTKG